MSWETIICQTMYATDLHIAECYIKRDVYNGVEGCEICHRRPLYVKRRTQQTCISLSVISRILCGSLVRVSFDVYWHFITKCRVRAR